jgi:hypothetical protein
MVGVILFASGVGAAVVGGYGAVQSDLGLCGQPVIGVESSEGAVELGTGAAVGPELARFEFTELSAGERAAFEEALAAVDNEGTVDGPFPHRSAFRNGSIVAHGGSEYRVSVRSMNRCVSVSPLLFPAGLGGVVAGAVAWSLPALRSRRYGREDGRAGAAVPESGPASAAGSGSTPASEPAPAGGPEPESRSSTLLTALREGNYADPTTTAALLFAVGAAVAPVGVGPLLGVPLAALITAGVLVGGVAVGVAAPTPSRAFVLGGYQAGATLLALGLAALWLGVPLRTGVAVGVPWLPLWATSPAVAVLLAPPAAVAARWLG